ncbi:MAG TPA: hypothetical protein VIH40_10870 [Xanthobacteraceae bacterium]
MHRPNLEDELRQFEARLPPTAARCLRWLLTSSGWLRIPLAFVLVFGGMLGFLPILGFWMIPLGLVLVAQDFPFLRPRVARVLAWACRKLPPQSRSSV